MHPLKSQLKLNDDHAHLRKVIELAASEAPDEYSFIVTEGIRSIERQREMVAKKVSRTMKSRHLHGLAVDLAVVRHGTVSWHFPDYVKLAHLVRSAAAKAEVPITWGGDWETLRDGPHFELPHAFYPDPVTA